MILLIEAMNGVGAVLLQVVAALLLEELTFGGLVRLLVAPKRVVNRHAAPGAKSAPQRCELMLHKNQGERK